MGRPIKATYFGTPKGIGEGGEGIASITVGGTNNNYVVKPNVSIAAPSTPDGVQATATVTSMGVATVVSIVNGGTGYTANAIVALTGGTGTEGTIKINTVNGNGVALTASVQSAGALSVLPANVANVSANTGGARFSLTYAVNGFTVGTTGAGYLTAPNVTLSTGNATGAAVLTTSTGNSIQATANVAAGGAKTADILGQKGSKRYKVQTTDGTAVCKLVASDSPQTGEMYITATDSAGGTYYVTKLESRVAMLVRNTGTQFANGVPVSWNLTSAVANTSVKINNA